jgi:hypothetical protein
MGSHGISASASSRREKSSQSWDRLAGDGVGSSAGRCRWERICFLFFGLVKQPARASDPVAALEHARERYRERLFSTVERVASEDMPRVQGAIEAHAKALGGFLQHSLASAK